MKFVPSKLEKTADNSRGKESWKDKLKNLTSVVGVLLVLYFVIGLLADFVAMRISEDTEGKVFGSAFSVLQSESAPPEFGQAEEIFDRLIRNSELRPLPYSLVYWDENTPNAFAAPGGGVIVTQGLLDTVTNETALAFVLSHELGHHQHRHTLKAASCRWHGGAAALPYPGISWGWRALPGSWPLHGTRDARRRRSIAAHGPMGGCAVARRP